MSKYDHLEASEIQSVLLEDYKLVLDIFQKHGVKVFAIGGTALGAVREKGFIPWDDDIDLGLSRRELEYIIANKQEFEREMPEHLKIIRQERFHTMMVADMRYKVNRVNELNEGYIGIDLTPIEGVPNSSLRRLLHSIKVYFYRACYKMCFPNLIGMGSWRSRWQVALIKLMKKCWFLFKNPQKYSKKWENSMKEYEYDEQEYIAIYVGKYLFKDIYPKDWFEPGIEMPFDDTTVLVPSRYDNYLSRLYGNYMTPPSELEKDKHIL